MPIRKGKDKNGFYYRWGNQKKYYYDPYSLYSENQAYSLSVQQARAIFSSGYKG